MKKILIIVLTFLFTNLTIASDDKPGRFFKDQPDVTDDFQIHIIYLLGKKGKDKKRDLNGWIEKEVKKIDDLFFKLTGKNQRFKFDYRKDGKLFCPFLQMRHQAYHLFYSQI